VKIIAVSPLPARFFVLVLGAQTPQAQLDERAVFRPYDGDALTTPTD
jgi:hypothetical protein